ncbi:transmembrane anchored protein [Rhizobium sp. VS19-DR104.2]|uniref:transmembrane anchored protein n=1 Tax=unclassified Rhizobium TaxID=2613769 RepID=UPI001CC5E457|nr:MULTISPECIES: transmembrane anchored protein [unclassified Rhizobium]MBZ5757967.1 transmembrane anchored protein [Rhizobium sp. VS19-DR96]MBZ5765203.1 transmembrane anchored protein [Rhizobium sp. VS19-DR129.2]MBZ5772746.1 transmembrane anchored protein [Rhizobium sp. VS19-DRK62.2]MBZ5782567.1 transmembrane anchored protein [Rhizobium sp. VS19-DR121]MBZ5800015.1 transmembrane anchored protein [Rhizobium sp. VS19-DR181]
MIELTLSMSIAMGGNMKKIVLALLLTVAASTSAFAGNCQHHNDKASDGSTCGNRSADDKAGGN